MKIQNLPINSRVCAIFERAGVAHYKTPKAVIDQFLNVGHVQRHISIPDFARQLRRPDGYDYQEFPRINSVDYPTPTAYWCGVAEALAMELGAHAAYPNAEEFPAAARIHELMSAGNLFYLQTHQQPELYQIFGYMQAYTLAEVKLGLRVPRLDAADRIQPSAGPYVTALYRAIDAGNVEVVDAIVAVAQQASWEGYVLPDSMLLYAVPWKVYQPLFANATIAAQARPFVRHVLKIALAQQSAEESVSMDQVWAQLDWTILNAIYPDKTAPDYFHALGALAVIAQHNPQVQALYAKRPPQDMQ